MGLTLSKTRLGLRQDAKLIVSRIKKDIVRNRKVASGELSRSVKMKFTKEAFTMTASRYFDFVDKGVIGTKGSFITNRGTPYKFENFIIKMGSIDKWMRIKGIDKKFDYAIRSKIAQRGIEATHMVRSSVDIWKKGGFKNVIKGLVKDLTIYLKKNNGNSNSNT